MVLCDLCPNYSRKEATHALLYIIDIFCQLGIAGDESWRTRLLKKSFGINKIHLVLCDDHTDCVYDKQKATPGSILMLSDIPLNQIQTCITEC